MRKLRYFLCGRFFPFALMLALLLVTGLLLILWLPRLLAPVAVLERILALTAAVMVCADGGPAESKLTKAVLILLLPWTGAVFCLIFRGGEGGHSKGSPSPDRGGVKAPCTLKTADYFPVGREMYLALTEDVKRAKKFVYLEFYIAAEGLFLSNMLQILEERAERGIDVRLILDGFGSALTLPAEFAREAARRGIRVLFFRPLGVPSERSQRRDHRKIAVIDGEIAYTGGINLADEYIGEKIRFGHWKDTAVRVTGGAARTLCALFAETWNALDPASPILPPAGMPRGGIPCAVISDRADKGDRREGRDALMRLFAGAKERLYINTPYLAPDFALMRALETAAQSGTDVRIMIPHIPDKKLPFLLTRSYAAELARNGVKVMEYTDGFLHAKSVVADGAALISSYNLDFRSLYLQAECGILVRGKAFADRVAADFLSVWETGTPLPVRGAFSEFFGRVLRLAAPIF